MPTQQSSCQQNAKLYNLILKLKRLNPRKKLTFTSEQIYNLCNYTNGLPYDRKILAEFIK
jgi:hypothetical protein